MKTTEPESVLKALNAVLRSTKLYPAGHPAIKKAAEKALEEAAAVLAERDSFLVGLVEGALVFEERPVADSKGQYPELLDFMNSREVGTIIFTRGLVSEEVTTLAETVSSTEVSGEALCEALRDKGILHITLQALTEGQKNFVEVYRGAVEAVVNAMAEVRMGKIPRAGPVNRVVDDITESVFADSNAMIGLTMIKNYDNYLFNHSVNVSILAISLAKAMGLGTEEIHAVGVASLLHDLGKTGVSEEIIRKPGGLSSEEWEKVKEHPLIGSEILERMDGVTDTVPRMVYEHHIKYDLSGYPEKHGELHPFSQIITICDAYDALTTLRVYQRPHSPVEAIKIMNNFSGRNFDPEILKVFTDMLGIYPVGTMVRLDTNEVGVVTRVNQDAPDRPTVKILYNSGGARLKEPFETDLYTDGERTIAGTVNPASVEMELGSFFEKEVV